MAVSSGFLALNRPPGPPGAPKPLVDIKDIHWNDERRTIVIGGATIALTPTEYRLLYPLRHGLPVTYNDLAMIVYHRPVDEKVRTMMDKHIERIREKLRDKGRGIYVYCVLYYGYILLP